MFNTTNPQIIARLIEKGVRIYNPHSIEIGSDVRIDRICKGAILHCGTKLFGSRTYICERAVLGYEGAVTVENCQIGPEVELRSGFFRDAVFLKGAVCGAQSHVREGTIMEEGAGIAHCVGLKQTILFPYVTLGSLINFCDCLMSGGTGPKNHSEVGSSYIHFNFTPNQDKATPSLIGDVPRGVMLNQAPIFLGGQGGLVGPCRIAYGTVISAGTVCRKDQLKPNHLVFESNAHSGSIPYKSSGFRNINRILFKNFLYLANLSALFQWYEKIRSLFVGKDFPSPMLIGLKDALQGAIEERIKQLSRLIEIIKGSMEHGESQLYLCGQWHHIESLLQSQCNGIELVDIEYHFKEVITRKIDTLGCDYLKVIKALSEEEAEIGTRWLDQVVGRYMTSIAKSFPSLNLSLKT